MKKLTFLFVLALYVLGLSAQNTDTVGVIFCEVPSIIDTLRGETPECPVLGVPTVTLNTTTNRVEFSCPMTGGSSFEEVQGQFMVTIDGVPGQFLVQGTFNANHTVLSGSVAVNGDNAMSGLDLRDRTLHVTARISGCHPAGAQDPTSSAGVVSQTVTYNVPAECLFVFTTSQYQRVNGAFQFKANFTGSKTGISNYRFIIQNAAGETVTTASANVIGNSFVAMVSPAWMASNGVTVGTYTAIPAVNPVYASCPSTGQPMTFEILPACPEFGSLMVYTDGEQYQLRAYIDLTSVTYQNPSFDITATSGQYAGGSSWYVDPSHQFIATPMTALPTQQTVLQATATLDVRCGVDLVDNGYVSLSSETVSLTIPMACPVFYNTEDALSGGSYRMLSHIDLTGGYDHQNAHFVVKESADSTDVSATYNAQSLEMASAWIPTTQNFPWANKTITLYPVVEVKCGLSMSNYMTVTGPAITRSFVSCPVLGNISLNSNQAQDPNLRRDTLFVQIQNYNADLIHQMVFTVTKLGTSTSSQWVADGWSAAHGAAYKVLSLAQLQQLGLSTTDIVATVDVLMEVNANSVGCTNASVDGQVTLTALPECPVFPGAAVTQVTQDYDGNITVTTPVQYYNPALIHHTGVTGQDSLYFTVYVNTSSTTQIGTETGTLDAVYNAQTQMMTCTIPFIQVTPNARYDFVPHIHLDGYCNPSSGSYVTVDGPSGSVVTAILCPAYGPTTNAVRNADGSVTVTHQLVNYNPAMLNPSSLSRVYGYDSTGTQRISNTNGVTISQDGLLSCTLPASRFTNFASHNMIFRPRIYLSTTYCATLPNNAPLSNPVCIPYSDLPSFTGVSHSDGLGKVNLFTNEGVVLTSKIVGSGVFAVNQVAQAGYLLSREPITGYDANKAVFGTLGGSTGDTLTYTVGIDSCGGVTYYRPFLIMKGCDPQMVLGPEGSFTMWEPDFTVSADPDHVAAGGTVTLNAVTTMNVGAWDQPTGYGVPCNNIGTFVNNCGLTYTEDCSTTKRMEVWMYLLVGLRNCQIFWDSFSNVIINTLGMDPGYADFQYRWERNGSVIFSTSSSSQAGTTTVMPTSTTTYTGVSDFSYNGVHCVQRRNVTVAVP
ncbi:MAG: hypothetical protein J6X98_08885 [Bacteroidales bacterium]|nr:hypothetical protein [Bacteroidales bacterium]